MFRFYPLVILIQAFCLYHAYTHKSDGKWFWIILFFPLVGGLAYLYVHFYNKKNLTNLKEGVKETLTENYRLKKLQQQVAFSDTHSNRMALGTEHMILGNLEKALEIFTSCQTGVYQEDIDLNKKLLQVQYLKDNYKEAINYGNKIINEPEFKHSDEMTAYAWALHKTGQTAEAEEIFDKMDVNYCNYKNRLEYCYFLEETKGANQARVKLDELLREISEMDTYERKVNKKEIQGIKYLDRQIKKI